MSDKIFHANRIGPTITPDRTRVLLRPFYPSRRDIIERIVNNVLSLSDSEAEKLFSQILGEFEDRHEHMKKFLNKQFTVIQRLLLLDNELPILRKFLIGSYFTHEYSPEAAALFNPSIVAHPDQTNLPEGSFRFILSLRATGEGHISSITFRTGTINANNRITLIPVVSFVSEPDPVPNSLYEKSIFARKLEEAGLHNHFCSRVMNRLTDTFVLDELRHALEEERKNSHSIDLLADRAGQGILMLAESNFEVNFDPDSRLSQRIIFPSVPSQSNGIEDARFVKFQENRKGEITYYATYTAYDGKSILPQLMETKDFLHFKFITLNGPAAQNKGMALFPRKINGQYVMLSRQDDENILIMFSDNIHFWKSPSVLARPSKAWEFMKIGTCGSPIETEAGWIVLTHGVGPMRKYCLSAILLDLNDPTMIIGRLNDPLLQPNETEREGYVPNVVYTCGALLQEGTLIIPYAMSDYSSSFASVLVKDLLEAMK
ncbi:MAG: glycoside hydrolase family 130 protein [Spirochaetes bacterium]|nr:glycoside hydrolase family 130 protein [Spirochaetota bacterium]